MSLRRGTDEHGYDGLMKGRMKLKEPALWETLPHAARLNMIEFHTETPSGPLRSIRFSKSVLKAKAGAFGFSEESFVGLGTHYFISFSKG